MAYIKGITIQIDGDTTPLQKALSSLNKSIKDTSFQLKDVGKLLKFDPKNTTLLTQKQGLLSKRIKDVEDKLKLERDALAQLSAKDQTPEVKEQMEQLERQIIEDEQALKSAQKELKQFGSVGKQQALAVSEQFKKVGKNITDAGKSIKEAGDQMTQKVTAPIVAVGSASVVMASTFEDAMAKVSTIADDTVAIDDLRQQIMDLSDQTGISAAEIAENVYNAISAGQDTADAVAFVAEAAKLSRAGFADSAAALDILTTVLNAYGMEAEDVTKVSDILINTQNLGKTTVGELASAMGKVIPTAKANGVELEELASAYAVMTSNGIATAETTTYLNSMLNELGKEGTDAADAFREGTQDIQEGGLSLSDAMERGWTLADVLGVLKEQADENGTSIANMFGSAEAGKAANVLADNTQKYTESLQSMNESAGATDEAFAKLDTTSLQAQKTLNELKNLGIEIGTVLLEKLAPALSQAKLVIEDLKAKWDELSPATQDAIIKAAMIAAVIGPIVGILGSIVMFVGGLITACGVIGGALTALAGPVGIVIAIIAVLIAKIAYLITHWDSLKAKVKDVWGKISEYCTNLKENVTSKFEEIKNNVSNKIQSIKTDMQNKWNAIKQDVTDKVVGMKNDVVNKIIELKNKLSEKLGDIKQKFVDKFGEIKDKVKGFIDDIKGFFTNLKLKIPKPELPSMPSFSLKTSTKNVFGREITYPSGIDINWNAKAMNTPYMFTTPAIMQAPYIGGGEAGHELMYGHHALMNDITNAVSANNTNMTDAMYIAFSAALKNTDFSVNIGRREFGRIVREAL